MSLASCATEGPSRESIPAELVELRERVDLLPPEVRAKLDPIVSEVLEQARFRTRALTLARDALEWLHLDLELARFDLDATRREREALRRRVEDQD